MEPLDDESLVQYIAQHQRFNKIPDDELPDAFYRYLGKTLSPGQCRRLWSHEDPSLIEHLVDKWKSVERLYRDDGDLLLGRTFYNSCDPFNRGVLQEFWSQRKGDRR